MAQQVATENASQATTFPKHQFTGKMYFVRDEAMQAIKIGYTEGDPEERVRQLQTGNAGKLTLLHQMPGTRKDENYWHTHFAYARIGGEWFRPEPELLKAIEDHKASKNGRGGALAGPKPFEPPFWTRYSPHHEFPLSTAVSVSMHVLAFVFLIVAGWFLATMIEKSKIEVGTLEESTLAGGGGSRHGEGNAGGDRPPVSQGQENVENPATETPKPTGDVTPLDPLKTKIADPLDVILKDPDGRAINEANEAVQSLKKLSTDARSKLLNAIGPGKGKGGSGRDGGQDSGKDTGKDKFTGSGVNKFSQRQTRVLRWVMRFNTLNGNDYRRQLAGLGAILAFPQSDGSYMVYRDLRAPAKGEIEDIASIKRIFWVDDKKDSIRSLAGAMEVPVPDGPVVAFFPVSLEAELLKKELAYRGKKEEDIKETHFKINVRGGNYIPEVVEQY
jgi:hypothetical protein